MGLADETAVVAPCAKPHSGTILRPVALHVRMVRLCMQLRVADEVRGKQGCAKANDKAECNQQGRPKLFANLFPHAPK